RQTGAVVDHVDHDIAALALDRNQDTAAPQLLRRHGRDRFGRVLHDVGQRLADQAPIELRRHVLALRLDLNVDIGTADALQEYDLPDGVGHIFAGHHRLWHAGKARELVDHTFDVVDLPHNGVGALFENGSVLGNHLAVLALQPLGGKLDRRERVFDLVGDAARN